MGSSLDIGAKSGAEQVDSAVESHITAYTALLNGQLTPHQLGYWENRWAHEVRTMRRRLNSNRNRFYALRGISVVAGVIVPALVGVNLSGSGGIALEWVTLVFSIIGGGTIALAEALQISQRYRVNRAIFPYLYREGLMFATLSGPYQHFSDHKAAVVKFQEATEHWVDKYEKLYSEDILAPHDASGKEGSQPPHIGQ